MIVSEPILEIKDLQINYVLSKKLKQVVSDINLNLFPREVLALVGESGSGKSTIALSISSLLPKNTRITGSIKYMGNELIGLSESELNHYRGNEIATIFQEPATAMNPVYTIGWQIIEAIRTHRKITKAAAKAEAVELLYLVGMPDPEKRINYYPHQLSGGQIQRAMIAQALALEPRVLIADEPTTALDVTVQQDILNLLRGLKEKLNFAVLLITHDLGVVADIADRVSVLQSGRLVEQATVRDIFYQSQHDYTKTLLNSVPKIGEYTKNQNHITENSSVSTLSNPDSMIELRNVSVVFNSISKRNSFKALDDISMTIAPNEVIGLVGESGSGKSTLGKTLVGLQKLSLGTLTIAGVNITNYSREQLAQIRRKIGVIFQNPGSSLNPRWPIGQAIAEPILVAAEGKRIDKAKLKKAVAVLLDKVELSVKIRNRYPHELSGGQRQRVAIARAIANQPMLLIADEPTSALDVSVQAKIVSLFNQLQQELHFACLFITHDLAVVEQLADRIAVLKQGKLVEIGTRQQILLRPQSEYTQQLLAAVPIPDPVQQQNKRLG